MKKEEQILEEMANRIMEKLYQSASLPPISTNIDQIEEKKSVLGRLACPKVHIHGWWWKKYFKKYRDQKDLMQDFVEYTWRN